MTPHRILLADDDPKLLEALTIRFRGRGFEVVTAGDAIQAVALARRDLPDVILLDIAMPAGDGFSVYERIREIEALAATPVVFLTGLSSPEVILAARRSGARALLTKPIDGEHVVDTIERVLDESPDPRSRALDELQQAADAFARGRRADAA